MQSKRGSTLFLKAAILLIAAAALAALIRFPLAEGRAAHLDLVSIYADPFIMYGYVAAIPFFIALYQALKLLGYVDSSQVFSQAAVKAVRNIKYCALATGGFIFVGILAIRFFANGDDPAGPTGLGMVLIFGSIVAATGAAVFERLLQNAAAMKSENDLTV